MEISKRLYLLLFLFLFLSFNSACAKVEESNLPINETGVNFCELVAAPQRYQSKIIQTKAIVLGYHTFIFYSGQCLTNEKVAALEMDYEQRHKLGEAIAANKINYKTNFLNSNLYAEITVSGELKENNEIETDFYQSDVEIFRPKYKFFVSRIENINILAEEIYPSEEARGVRIVNQ